VRTFCGHGGSSEADIRTFSCKKLRFSEIYDASASTGGLSQCEQGRLNSQFQTCGT